MARAKLLLVDDDESVLSGLKGVLEAYEFEVTTASNVTEALKHITSESFDVLLSDLHMPGAGDGLIVVSAMRHAHPQAVTILLSANPDMAKAVAAILRQADEIVVKPVKAAAIVKIILQRLDRKEPLPRSQAVEAVATMLERESASVTNAWYRKMMDTAEMSPVRLTLEDRSGYLQDALSEVVYRLRNSQPLGSTALFSMASLQHGARRRRQGFPSPILVEEARALQLAIFETIDKNIDRVDLGQLPKTLMAIADEVNAQLLQTLSGYENEKPVNFGQEEN